jgi:hypothetical protein
VILPAIRNQLLETIVKPSPFRAHPCEPIVHGCAPAGMPKVLGDQLETAFGTGPQSVLFAGALRPSLCWRRCPCPAVLLGSHGEILSPTRTRAVSKLELGDPDGMVGQPSFRRILSGVPRDADARYAPSEAR